MHKLPLDWEQDALQPTAPASAQREMPTLPAPGASSHPAQPTL